MHTQQLLQNVFTQVKCLFTQGKKLGLIDKYKLEMSLSTTLRDIELDETATALEEVLLNLQKVLQVMVDECQAVKLRLHHFNQKHSALGSEKVLGEVLAYTTHSYQNEPGGDDLLLHQEKHLPTTKETEAANVLMNLSGKATDRHAIAEVFQEVDPCAKHTGYVLSPTSIQGSNTRRELTPCDEVPQINENDLLPLATQVLCQFCCQQCEDVVELHEHVLAMHNISENDPPLMPTYKKIKVQCINEVTIDNTPEESDKKQDIYTFNSEACTSTMPMPDKTAKKTKSNNDNREPKKIKTRHKTKNDTKVFHLQGKQSIIDSNHDESTEKERKEQDVVCIEGVNNKEIDEFSLERVNFNLTCGVKPRKNVNQNHTKVTDALALAIESSKIRVLETKITFNVCVKCSSCYTNPQEFKQHICLRVSPIIEQCADGSVSLIKPTVPEDDVQQEERDMWYFPDFLIKQRVEVNKQPSLEVIDTVAGHRLQLHTAHQPSYLGEQLISFKCSTCDKEWDSLGKFLGHLTAGPCMFRCPECGLVYVTQDKLQRHRATLHPTLQDRTCPNCHEVFEKRHQRNKHLKTHCSNLHICDTCGSVLKNEYNLRVHMQSHQDKNHICSECGAAFHRQVILRRHMMQHSGNKPHECTECHARFYTRQHLNTHMDRHRGLRRFPCSMCEKAYYSKYDRDTHFSKVHNKTEKSEIVLQKFLKE